MFESAELGHRVDKEHYKREEPKLRAALLAAQYALKNEGRFAVLVIVAGPEGAGRSETVNVLKEWMDPRHLRVKAFDAPSDEERARPSAWRYWRALPPKGQIGILFNAWYTEVFAQRVVGGGSAAQMVRRLTNIRHQEAMLAAEGVLIVKFWLHLSAKDFHTRRKTLAQHAATRWRVAGLEQETFKHYKKLKSAAARGLAETSTVHAPWIVVEGLDERYRNLHVGTELLNALRVRLALKPPKPPKPVAQHRAPSTASRGERNLLDALDLDKRLEASAYDAELAKWQGRLSELTHRAKFRKIALLAAFEGNDAAGKGGAIRRVAAALDARIYEAVPIAAPSDEERAQPYLWRFWRHVPGRGRIAIFDRSWYGRVLVERVEGLCTVADWMRAYDEINAFEASLAEHGIVVAKFWLAISKDEQHRRFKERERLAYKRHKITAEDWRNRERWDDYVAAVCDMVDRTSTEPAPWVLVEANDKRYARIKVLRTLCERIADAL